MLTHGCDIYILRTKRRSGHDAFFNHNALSIFSYTTKYLRTGANFVHVYYIEMCDKGILKFNKFAM